VLMPYGPREQWAYRAIAPKAGDALLFEHRVWHEGRQVNSGEKYVLRTDLFYQSE
jgi:prolyl 4-hydroxylase